MYKRDDILTPLASGKEPPRSKSGAKDITRPRMQPETNPGTRTGTRPGIHPGMRPNTNPDTNPGTRPGKQNDPRAEERYYSNSEIIIIEDLKEIPKFNKSLSLA